MNKFLVLACCLASLVSARPDVSLGYHSDPNYNSGADLLSAPFTSSYAPAASGAVSSVDFLSPGYNVAGLSSSGSSYSSSSGLSSGGLAFGGASGLSGSGGLGFSGSSGLGSSSGLGYSSGGGYSNSGGLGYSSGGGLGLGTGYSGGSQGVGGGLGYNTVGYTGGNSGGVNQGFSGGVNQGYNYGASIPISGQYSQQYAAQFQQQAPIITKSFYIHSAPEEHDEQQVVRYINIGRPLKNYRVLFINAPSSTSTKAKIIANVAPVEDRTAIYVLSKKSNDLDISADVVTPPPTGPNKPDVFFIKYKTPQEAIHAQHVIQAQYDQLGGQSSYSNEGFAPVQSVIGHLGPGGGAVSSGGGSSTIQIPTQYIAQSGGVQGPSQFISSGGGSSLGGSGQFLTSGSGSGGGSGQFLTSGGGSGGGSGQFLTSGGSAGGGSTQFISSGSSDLLSGGILPDQSQIDQVSGGRIQPQPKYLPPSKYKRY